MKKVKQEFHYGFALNETETILHKALANMHDNDLIVNGGLYLTNERIVFVGYVPNSRTRVSCEISLFRIKEVRPEKTFYFFNNIIRVISISDEEYKLIVDNQTEWLKQINRQLQTIGA